MPKKTTNKKSKAKTAAPAETATETKPTAEKKPLDTFFSAVDIKQSFPKLEDDILSFWRDSDIFRKTIDSRAGGKEFIFYEGPPTANGKPGVHHVIARVFKDIILRYRTMQGYRIERKAGWDTHGLPVELQVEKELGISGKKQIEEYGIEEFNQKCKESVHRFTQAFEEMTERIGYWVDMKNPYVTYEPDYIESVWWSLKQIWEKGLLYRDLKIVPYCCRCGTPLSSHEVAQEYQTVKDLSLTALAQVKATNTNLVNENETVYLAAWTTTPWTLPGNVAICVGPNVRYAKIRLKDNSWVFIAEERIAAYHDVLPKNADNSPNIEIQATFEGNELVGAEYEPLWPYYTSDKKGWYVIAEPFVTTTDGTGLVQIALYGEDDFQVITKYDLPRVQHVSKEGKFIAGSGPYTGRYFKEEGLDIEILKDLASRDLLLKKEKYEHNYPHCWRCKTPLVYFAISSWFIRMSQLREELMANNETVNWYPEHIKHGRFGNWLAEVKDWALSRNRYWGTPLPIWECQSCGKSVCVGSMIELQKKSGQPLPLNKAEEIDLHRPYIDQITLNCECGGTSTRVEEVIDCWFDSGAVPIAQQHYPFALTEEEFLKNHFPADYICEAIDQTRGWFYTLMAINTILFNQSPYKNVICLGHILDEQGRKMSKSLGNIVDPMEVTNIHGADALRWYMFSASPPGQPRSFSLGLVEQSLRKFLLTLWNVYAFFVTYANIDHFEPKKFTKIIALTHTEAENDSLGLCSLDKEHTYHLTEQGRRDADGIAQELKHTVMDRIYVSPLMRTQEMAQIISQFHNVPVTVDERIGEMDIGTFESKSLTDIQEYITQLKNPYAESFPEGESYLDVEKRCFAFLEELKRKHEGETILVVTHSAVKKMVQKYFYHTPSDQILNQTIIPGLIDRYVMSWSEHKLDRWILSELHTLVDTVASDLDNYRIWEATGKIELFVDNLSNWYVRRSRRRFWKTENDQDKIGAYQTLYHVLSLLTRIIAPFTPFISEHIYKNLVKQESVHMANYPQTIQTFIRPALNEEMAFIRTVVNLGHAIRAAQKLKTRQPLSSVAVIAEHRLSEEEKQVIAEELNVKTVQMTTAEEGKIKRSIKPIPAILGPKYGKDVQKILQAVREDKFTLVEDGTVIIADEFTLLPEEVEIVYQAEPGMSVISQGSIVVALDTQLTDELIWEGYAREIVRHIQEMRKNADYQVDSRINVNIEVLSEGELAHKVLSNFSSYIARETLANTLTEQNLLADREEKVKIDEIELLIKIEPAQN
ncbi:MAG: isoleucine--tRNA ligase [Candidatus Abawacabacteria bacterium]|nr:isoleucine--tRNA ligase [Candidatus Abawacabacteria bacterium]